PDAAIIFQCQHKVNSCRDGGTAGQYLYGGGMLSSITVVAQCPDGTVIFQGYGLDQPRTYGNDAAESGNLRRRPAISANIRTAQLSIVIITPAPYGAVIFEGKRVQFACGDGNDTAETRYCCRNARATPVAQLPIRVKSPTPDGSAALQCQGVIKAGSHGSDIIEAVDISWRV